MSITSALSSTLTIGLGPAGLVKKHRAELLLSVRIIVASVLTFAIAHLLGFKQSYWAVLTALIVMQSSVGGSIKATGDRFIGSLGGAVWGVLVCLVVPHADVFTLALALALAIAPLAVVVAFNPAMRVAPVTSVIILLTPTSALVGPVAAAFQRMLEVGLGSVVAVAVAFLLAPAKSVSTLGVAASRALSHMADLIIILMAGLIEARDPMAVEGLHAKIRHAIGAAETADAESRRERAVSLPGAPDLTGLCRTLRRLHHDLVAIGRASTTPLPPKIQGPLAEPAAKVAKTIAAYLRRSGAALHVRATPPSPKAERAALREFSRALAGLRAAGLSRALSDDDVARLFGLAFALEQLGQNLKDLNDRTAELARGREATEPEHEAEDEGI
jgi:uncharacterized membrane protein YccC